MKMEEVYLGKEVLSIHSGADAGNTNVGIQNYNFAYSWALSKVEAFRLLSSIRKAYKVGIIRTVWVSGFGYIIVNGCLKHIVFVSTGPESSVVLNMSDNEAKEVYNALCRMVDLGVAEWNCS